MKTIAVLVSGQMRTLDKCYRQIKTTMPKNADYYVYAVKDEDSHKASLLDPRAILVEPEPQLPERSVYFRTFPQGGHGVQQQLRQLYSKYKMWQFYKSQNIHHDWIIRVRSDNIFLTSLDDLSKTDDAIYIPPHGNWFGLNDQFAHGPRHLMETYYQRWDYLDEYIDNGGIFHTERFLKWALRDIKVLRSTVWVSILRKDETLEGPWHNLAWSDPEIDIPEVVYLENLLRTGW
jgi:hypothetical protein